MNKKNQYDDVSFSEAEGLLVEEDQLLGRFDVKVKAPTNDFYELERNGDLISGAIEQSHIFSLEMKEVIFFGPGENPQYSNIIPSTDLVWKKGKIRIKDRLYRDLHYFHFKNSDYMGHVLRRDKILGVNESSVIFRLNSREVFDLIKLTGNFFKGITLDTDYKEYHVPIPFSHIVSIIFFNPSSKF
jgi:hypothetical protein